MKTLAILATAALLCACEAKVDTGDGNRSEAAGGGEVAKAEEGKIALKGPGFDLKIDVPDMAKEASIEEKEGLIYPGSSITGLTVDANAMQDGKGGAVDLRFASADAPEKVVAWYRDGARAPAFTLAPGGSGGKMEGITRPDGDRFSLELTPKAGGGTEARLTIHDQG